jgi:predicted enzyme related to lactoylglutathione lyase
MRAEHCIDYVEVPVTNPKQAQDFFASLFGWSFQSWGDDYISFNDGRLDGGFRRSHEPAPPTGVLLVFYSEDLERDVARVQELGAKISQEIFAFPGGRRFHFIDPTGTEYAMWSAVAE